MQHCLDCDADVDPVYVTCPVCGSFAVEDMEDVDAGESMTEQIINDPNVYGDPDIYGSNAEAFDELRKVIGDKIADKESDGE